CLRPYAPHFHHCFYAVHASRHFQINERNGIVRRFRQFQRRLAVRCGVDAIAVLAQPCRHRLAHHFFIVNHQNWPGFLHFASPSEAAKLRTRCAPQRPQYRSSLLSTSPICVARLITHFESAQCVSPNVCPNSCSTSFASRSRNTVTSPGSP